MDFRRSTIGVLRKLRINKIVARLYYRYAHGFSSATRELPAALERCFDVAMELGTADRGDYYEFGIFKGYSLWKAQQLANERGLTGMRFFGFDSFAGLPTPSGIDETEEEFFYGSQYACSLEAVTRNLTRAGADWNRTRLIEGYFADSLTEETKRREGMRAASIVVVDCDLYSSARSALHFVKDLLLPRSILVLDDWNAFDKADDRGERRAFREFLEENEHLTATDLFEYGTYGKTFLLEGGQAKPTDVG